MNIETYNKASSSQICSGHKQNRLLGTWNRKPYSKDENEYPLWYKDGELNICHLALDQQKKGTVIKLLLSYDSPVTQTEKKIYT
jgi:propionyl-CoA synthetase